MVGHNPREKLSLTKYVCMGLQGSSIHVVTEEDKISKQLEPVHSEASFCLCLSLLSIGRTVRTTFILFS